MDDAEEKELLRLAEVIKAKLEAEASQALPLFAPETLAQTAKSAKRGQKLTSKGRPVEKVPLSDVVEEQRVVEGIGEVFGSLFDELGFSKIAPDAADTLKATVLARVANPVSKRRTAALLERDYGLKVPVDRIYRMMDALDEKQRILAQDTVRAATLALFPGKIDVVFFDVTTLYFESTVKDELRQFGYSKDQQFHSVQVVLALATTEQGLPIGYRLFHGSTAEVSTLTECLKTWRSFVDIGHVILVADRAMMSEDNLRALEDAHVEYVVGASLKKQNAQLKNQILESTNYKLGHVENDPLWVNEFSVGNNRRLITAFSASRARKDAADREQLVENLQKRLGKKSHGPLKNLVSNRGYIKVISTEGNATATLNHEKLAADALWDGMYGIITNSEADRFSLLSRYRRLWTIEESFRISKHDLAMRPIFHFKPERIEAHICICFLAYALVRHSQFRIRVRQHAMSVDRIRDELLRVQSSIVRDTKSGGRYKIPSPMTSEAKAIYKAFDLSRSATPSRIQ